MTASADAPTPVAVAFPMHGISKMYSEGFRTRDGHFLEHLSRRSAPRLLRVVSRPEPWPRWISDQKLRRTGPPLDAQVTYTRRVPISRYRQKWWSTSQRLYDLGGPISDETPLILWNPLVAASNLAGIVESDKRRVVVDLLDDWSIHYAFAGIRGAVNDAYRRCFERADYVFANSEGTADLAQRYGRDDVQILLNGCDPERFSTDTVAAGPTTVGYVGKIGRRLDLTGIRKTMADLPNFQFVFAGPILDPEYKPALADFPNATLLGDVHYANVPSLLKTFDIGWVPHRVGEGEVGGDVIKTYEYRASGLPVVTTPIAGAGKRKLDHVYVADASNHSDLLASMTASGAPRVERRAGSIPKEYTWHHKAAVVAQALGVG